MRDVTPTPDETWANKLARARIAAATGGQVGGHVVFRWRRSGRLNIVSLHAWTPIKRTTRTAILHDNAVATYSLADEP